MRLVALMRAVWDPLTVRISRTRGILDTRRAETILNPTDRGALEVALAWKDEAGAEVVALGIGRVGAEEIVHEAVAMGADSGTIVESGESDPLNPWSDLNAVELALESLRNYDLLVVGHRRAGYGVSLFGPRLAERLGVSIISRASRIVVNDKKVRADQFGARPVQIEAPMPCLLTADADAVSRYPTLAGAFLAFEGRRARRWSPDESALLEKAAQHHAAVEVRETAAEIREPVRLEGQAEEVARSLVSLLRSRGLLPDR
ncbi:MAG: electron transfer flavoprotein subunit beta/FixA family protein [Anaerolineae bacterium]